jgi:hypothetical protein
VAAERSLTIIKEPTAGADGAGIFLGVPNPSGRASRLQESGLRDRRVSGRLQSLNQ